MKFKLNHIALKVIDLKRAKVFYSKILGLKMINTCYNEKHEVRSFWFDLNGTILMIEKSSSKKRSSSKTNGWHMIALNIKTTERESWKKYLIKSGIKITKESVYSLYFHDSEKNEIAISHFPKKYDSANFN